MRAHSTVLGSEGGDGNNGTDVAKTGETRHMDWRDRALCRDEDPEMFFPVSTAGSAAARAKAVCAACTVARQCLSWALDNSQDVGIWGGLDENERRALKRRRARVRAQGR